MPLDPRDRRLTDLFIDTYRQIIRYELTSLDELLAELKPHTSEQAIELAANAALTYIHCQERLEDLEKTIARG